MNIKFVITAFKRTSLFRLLKYLIIKAGHIYSNIKIKFFNYKVDAINLGSGPFKSKTNLVNVDLYGSDLNLNLLKQLPFKSNSISFIYASHFLEHLYYHELEKLLDECFRVLKQGSQISIAVPNAGLYIQGYQKGESFISYDQMFEGGKINTGSMIDQINYIAYLGGDHKYMFDEENLLKMLEKHGFKDVSLRDFDPDLDKEWRNSESIYANGVKR